MRKVTHKKYLIFLIYHGQPKLCENGTVDRFPKGHRHFGCPPNRESNV